MSLLYVLAGLVKIHHFVRGVALLVRLLITPFDRPCLSCQSESWTRVHTGLGRGFVPKQLADVNAVVWLPPNGRSAKRICTPLICLSCLVRKDNDENQLLSVFRTHHRMRTDSQIRTFLDLPSLASYPIDLHLYLSIETADTMQVALERGVIET